MLVLDHILDDLRRVLTGKPAAGVDPPCVVLKKDAEKKHVRAKSRYLFPEKMDWFEHRKLAWSGLKGVFHALAWLRWCLRGGDI